MLFRGRAELDTDDLETLQSGMGKGLRAARRSFEEDKPPGLIRLFARLRDPDVRRALSALLALLKGMGGAWMIIWKESRDASRKGGTVLEVNTPLRW